MSQDAVHEFLAKVEADTGLQQELEAALSNPQGAVEAVLAAARSQGCEFTADEYIEVVQTQHGEETELSDSELEEVAGGLSFSFTLRRRTYRLFRSFRRGPGVRRIGRGSLQQVEDEEEEELQT